MPMHPEQAPPSDRFIRQGEQIMMESFRIAERIMKGATSGNDWHSEEAREKYFSSLPLVALEVKGMMFSIAQMTGQHNDRELDRIFDAFEDTLKSMRRIGEEKKGEA